jgi:hypothetical protein
VCLLPGQKTFPKQLIVEAQSKKNVIFTEYH